MNVDTDEFLTDAQLRKLLNTSRTTLWRLRRTAGLPYAKVGRQYRYRKAEVLQWLRGNPVTAQQLELDLPESRE